MFSYFFKSIAGLNNNWFSKYAQLHIVILRYPADYVIVCDNDVPYVIVTDEYVSSGVGDWRSDVVCYTELLEFNMDNGNNK